MSLDRNDGYAKLVNALTAAVITFKDGKDIDLHLQAKDALACVLGDVKGVNDPHPLDAAALDQSRLIPWQPLVTLIENEPGQWKVLVDRVDIGWTYDDWEKGQIALYAAQATVERMCKYGRVAAENFYREQVSA